MNVHFMGNFVIETIWNEVQFNIIITDFFAKIGNIQPNVARFTLSLTRFDTFVRVLGETNAAWWFLAKRYENPFADNWVIIKHHF